MIWRVKHFLTVFDSLFWYCTASTLLPLKWEGGGYVIICFSSIIYSTRDVHHNSCNNPLSCLYCIAKLDTYFSHWWSNNLMLHCRTAIKQNLLIERSVKNIFNNIVLFSGGQFWLVKKVTILVKKTEYSYQIKKLPWDINHYNIRFPHFERRTNNDYKQKINITLLGTGTNAVVHTLFIWVSSLIYIWGLNIPDTKHV